MSILSLIIAIVAVGVVLWLINAYIPMDEVIKKILNIVIVFVLLVWICNALGLFGYLGRIHT